MIEKISDKLIDILAADARLYEGGNAYAAGWTGVKREDTGATPTAGYVNLFDKPHDPDGTDHRPAVYVGTRGLQATDSEDFPTISAGGRFEYRVLLVPLIICVQAATKAAARRQCNQLRRNVKVILFDNPLADGFWYELTMPGGTGGASSERVWTTSTGGGSVAVAEGIAVVPVQVRYSWSEDCDA